MLNFTPSRTKAQFVSGKLPLAVVRQLGGVYKGVVVSVGALDDLPANFIFGFLREEECLCQYVNMSQKQRVIPHDSVMFGL